MIERIADPDNIRAAYLLASRGKRHQEPVKAFGAALDAEVIRIREDLLSGSMAWGPYHRFQIYDPKERSICAAPFRDRVVQHAIMAVCEPYFESYQVHDSYACRKGKGLDAALARARSYTQRRRWYAKLDVRKYFDSVDHEVLKTLLWRRFKDRRLMAVFESLIDGYSVHPGKGIPIGNLISQFFANHYLALWDHFAKEILRVRHYVRYMDDFVFWSDDKDELKGYAAAAKIFLYERLGLALKPLCLNACSRGMTFLGYRMLPSGITLSRRSRKRFRAKLSAYQGRYERGLWTEQETARHVEPLMAFVQRAPEDRYPRRTVETLGLCPRARTA
ncbi:MAG: group II intron reverse transcriptase domain-containing protein [Candidatus Hydrogenedentes bacterium]|nr:group II intron reverse transcriptase domain-containing protein [Candidatus Hydrogenedentota bacterium]